MADTCFIEVDFCQQAKAGQNISGDVFLCQRLEEGKRVVAVLADGLGSGAEAASLANLTAAMALQYVTSNIDLRRSGEIIMDVLPIDQQRQISYAMFSIADIQIDGEFRFMDYANPAFLLIRDGVPVQPQGETVRLARWGDREVQYWRFMTRPGDRVIMLSDGVTQSGLGSDQYPFGWGEAAAIQYACELLQEEPDISARMLSQAMVRQAIANDGQAAGDDITCGVIYLRQPRRLMVLSGPPFAREKDRAVAQRLGNYPGHTVICGGTTANIVARELGRHVSMSLADYDPEVPTPSIMEGVDLVTEGMLTMSKVVELLESGASMQKVNAATRFVELLHDSDIIEFVVGTSVNEAHQDPSLPIELDIRRNVIKKIVQLLEQKYLKQVFIEYI